MYFDLKGEAGERIATMAADAHSVAIAVNGGTVLGKRQPASADYPKALDVFYGVPYATAERFRPAVAVPPVRRGAMLDARAEGPVQPCPMAGGRVEESPLRLNIFRPAARAVPGGVVDSDEGSNTSRAPDEEPDKGEEQSRTERKLPVLVYIHGGAFNFGDPLERDLGAMVAWAPRDVLVVSVSYRLGALGFLGGDPDDDEGGDAAASGGRGRTDIGTRAHLNLGLRDQRLAVRWVADWIGAFGGEGGRGVTLMGVSAGAHSIGHHILSPAPLPSHAKSILESGSPTARSVLSARHPRPAAQLASLKAHARRATATATALGRTPPRQQPVKLSTLPLDDLLDAAVAVFGEDMASVRWPFQPLVEDAGRHSDGHSDASSAPTDKGPDDRDGDDDRVIPDAPLRLWDRLLGGSGRPARQRAVITGFCSHEGTQFVPTNAATNAAFLSFFATLIPGLSADDLADLERLYPDPVAGGSSSPYANPPGCPHAAQYTRLHVAYAHYAYICPVLHTVRALSVSSSASSSSASSSSSSSGDGDTQRRGNEDGGETGTAVYLYEFAALAASPNGGGPAASHGDSSAVVAHDMAHMRGRPGLRAVADAMNARWMAFAASPDGRLDDDDDDDGGGGGGGGSGSDTSWPRFESPFDVVDAATGRRGEGRLLVFGEGNDEAAGGAARGTPVRTRTLTAREMDQCRFWWDKMPLSQGMGGEDVRARPS
ncbi:phenmedipham hydrolase [Purpureocillium lavendulum]|uniref:Phenmedipham hydrolase n=1 Tax=Purpureocillium lavendulum TaxID=1247861 RepID=A0AB34FK21_9HYPO|nr:phenmedipham hydrolase [Purpureocillium lavendulum]